MSDPDQGEKKPGVPSWQLKSKNESPKAEEKSAPEPPSRETIIEQAKTFLEEDEVRNASTDKKIAFLESKGLQNEEIQGLLGIARNPEASSEVCRHLPCRRALLNSLDSTVTTYTTISSISTSPSTSASPFAATDNNLS